MSNTTTGPRGKRAAVIRASREIVEHLLPPGKVIDCVADKIGAVDYDWLRKAMLLPDDCRITGVSASIHFDYDQISIRVESPLFVETPPWNQLPEAEPFYRVEDGRVVLDRWEGPALIGWHPSPVAAAPAEWEKVLDKMGVKGSADSWRDRSPML